MLVLSRKLNERLVFPAFGTIVQVLGVRSNSVRLGIDAPPDVEVLREELCEPKRGFPLERNRSISQDK